MRTLEKDIRQVITEIYLRMIHRRKSRKPKTPSWGTLSNESRPVLSINTTAAFNKCMLVDWFHDDMFEVPVEDVFRDVGEDIDRPGYYATTLTFDRQKSSFVDDGKVRFDAMITGYKSSLDNVAKRYSKEVGRTVRAPAYVMQVDLHEDGFPHMHAILVPRNQDEVSIAQAHAAWWRLNHGEMHIKPIDGKLGVWKWIQYMFKDRYWHDNVPANIGLESVSKYRNLYVTKLGDIPKIDSIQLVIQTPETSEANIPSVAVIDDVMYPLSAELRNPIRSAQHFYSTDGIKSFASDSDRGLPLVFCAFVTTYARIESGVKRTMFVERLLMKECVNGFSTIWNKAGPFKAIQFLYDKISLWDSNVAWVAVDAAKRMKGSVGLRITAGGKDRLEHNLDAAGLHGVCVSDNYDNF